VAKATLDAFGRIDGLINNAGIGFYQPFLETTLADWERVMRVNLTSAFLLGQHAARAMARQGRGRIINIGSISGQRGGEGRSAYGTSKAGLMHLTRVMAVELAPAGIAVNAISPGPIETDLTQHAPVLRRAYLDRIPMGRYGEPEAVAAAAVFLLSDECRFVTGHVLDVDGGFMAAGLMQGGPS
jgi:3-oxoacyl-[acyl-carrier protein] reductase